MKRLAALFAAAAISLSALAGCADAGDEADEPANSAATSDRTETPRGSSGGSEETPQADETSQPDEAPQSGDATQSDQDGHDGDRPDEPNRDDGAASGAYCDAVDGLRTEFELTGDAVTDGIDIEGAARALRQVADLAPSTVEKDWRRLTDLFERVRSVLRRHDIDLSDAQSLQGLDRQAYTALLRAIREYKSPDVTAAAKSIAAEVRRDCGFSIG